MHGRPCCYWEPAQYAAPNEDEVPRPGEMQLQVRPEDKRVREGCKARANVFPVLQYGAETDSENAKMERKNARLLLIKKHKNKGWKRKNLRKNAKNRIKERKNRTLNAIKKNENAVLKWEEKIAGHLILSKMVSMLEMAQCVSTLNF